MSLSVLDRIKIKTKDVLIKTDDYLRETNYLGVKASQHAMVFAGVATMTGILGVMTIVAAPTLPALAGIAALASMPTTMTVGGAAINLAGISILGGGGTGIGFAALAKIYNVMREKKNDYVGGEFECVVKNHTGEQKYDQVVRVSRKDVLKSVENGTFDQKYDSIRIQEASFGYAYCRTDKNNLESMATLPYLQGDTQYVSKRTSEECQIIRRECFKEARSFSLKAKILDRIKESKMEGNILSTTNGYKI